MFDFQIVGAVVVVIVW